MVKVTKAFRRLMLCLVLALACTMAAAPVLQAGSSTVWAKNTSSKKKTTKKSTKKATKKKNGFILKNGRYYYYLEGKKQTGWITVGKRMYYAIEHGSRKGVLVTGWREIDGDKFFFREEGKKGVICSAAIDGTAKVNGITCVFDEYGELVGCKYAGNTNGFVNKVGELARMNQVNNNILASLVVAQACLETGFGSNVYYNNLFGIRQGTGYRKYDSYEDSIEDYVKFMHTYIPRIFGVRDWRTACTIIGRSGYAEASGYGEALLSLVAGNNLTRFDR